MEKTVDPENGEEKNLNQQILTPTQVADRIQQSFDKYLKTILVEGEIAGLARPYSGHLYFQLKDNKSILKAVIWKNRFPYSGGKIAQDGLRVLAKGALSVYGLRGEYQLIVEYLEPLGEGALRLAFEKLKKRLAEEGLFDPNRKRDLPYIPQRVAVLSSFGSAAANDFITTSIKRHKSAHLTIYPVRVQGAGAALEMAQAIADINSWGGFDLIVLTRGGGSLEDLWAFNEEVLVKAVAASRTKTLAAIGHSTDLSLVEMASDLKAITPTAAAEKIFPRDDLLLVAIAEAQKNLYKVISAKFEAQANKLSLLWRRLLRFETRLLSTSQTIDYLTSSLHQGALRKLSNFSSRLNALTRELELKSPVRELHTRRLELQTISRSLLASAHRRLEFKRQALNRAMEQLQLVSPLGVLARGYAVVTNLSGQVVHSAADLKIGENFNVRLAEGNLLATVSERTLGSNPQNSGDPGLAIPPEK
jgi:exodeoxyribonuclease VII large subunit